MTNYIERDERLNKSYNVVHTRSWTRTKETGVATKITEKDRELRHRTTIDTKQGIETEITLSGNIDALLRAENVIPKISENPHNLDPHNDLAYTRSHSKTYNDNQSRDNVIDWKKVIADSDKDTMERWSTLPPIFTCFYMETPEITNMTQKMVEETRMRNNIKVSYFHQCDEGRHIPNPALTFEQCFNTHSCILSRLREEDFVRPTPIQAQAWPILLNGLDLIAMAPIGTGKNLLSILPALIHISGQSTNICGPKALVLVPSRELALRIEDEVAAYHYKGIKASCVFGGTRLDQMKEIQMIISTPENLNYLIQVKKLDISSVTYLVLNQADRMLSMGCETQIRKILLDIRPQRQTVIVSTELSSGVRRLAQNYMRRPIQAFVGSMKLAAVHRVTGKSIIG